MIINTAKPKKTAVYARVSTSTQHGGLESQIRALREFCERNKITEYEVFADENESGAKISRPALDRMMTAVRAGEIEQVIVHAFSRFARSTTHLLAGLEEFKKRGVRFISLSEQIDSTSAIGTALVTLVGALSQLERELIIERVRAGLHNARMKGKIIGRKKTRPSELIRVLLKKKLPYRTISSIASCSHGAVWAEKKALLKEEQEKVAAAEAATKVENTPIFSVFNPAPESNPAPAQ